MSVTIISKHESILAIYLPFKNICSQNETKEIVVNFILSCGQIGYWKDHVSKVNLCKISAVRLCSNFITSFLC